MSVLANNFLVVNTKFYLIFARKLNSRQFFMAEIFLLCIEVRNNFINVIYMSDLIASSLLIVVRKGLNAFQFAIPSENRHLI